MFERERPLLSFVEIEIRLYLFFWKSTRVSKEFFSKSTRFVIFVDFEMETNEKLSNLCF